MSGYHYNGVRGPFRNSSGALAVAPSPPSPAGSTCSSCSSSPGHPHRSDSRRRRQSISDGVRIVDPRLSSDGRPAPIVIHRSPRVPSPPRTSLSMQNSHVGERGVYHASHALIVPASSIHRPRCDSLSGPLSANDLANHGYTRYYRSIQQCHGGNHSVVIRQGVTIFPCGLISREVIRNMDLRWKEDSEGRVVVQRELDGAGIQRLIDMTEDIRRRRDTPTGKAVSFHERPIVHEPHPDPDYTHRISKTITKTTTTIPGAFVPPPSHAPTITTPFIPLPGSSRASEEKLARAEEKAARAEDKAARLENRAQQTGRAKDEQEAYRARVKAEEKHRKVDQTLLKERVRMEEREGGARYHSINGRPSIRYRS